MLGGPPAVTGHATVAGGGPTPRRLCLPRVLYSHACHDVIFKCERLTNAERSSVMVALSSRPRHAARHASLAACQHRLALPHKSSTATRAPAARNQHYFKQNI
eukprot:354682-Chlamydomonas_euryale.AAC.5